ncbi:hypothetical protein SUDANB6_04156 [Streptomyces sp. enrichment culture]
MPIRRSDVLCTAGSGRDGRVATGDGELDVADPPEERGGSGAGTGPEQLSAAGHGACFQGALGAVARERGVGVSGSTVPAKAGIGRNEDGFGGIVEISGTSRSRTPGPPGSSSRRPTRCARTPGPPAGTSP